MTLAAIEAAAQLVDPALLGLAATDAAKFATDAAAKQKDAADRKGEFTAAASATSFLAAEKAGATLKAAEDTKTETDNAKAKCANFAVPLATLMDHAAAVKGINDKTDTAVASRQAAADKELEAVEHDKALAAEEKQASEAAAAAKDSDGKAAELRKSAAALEEQSTAKESLEAKQREDAANKDAAAKLKQEACDAGKKQAEEKEAEAAQADSAAESNEKSAAEQAQRTQQQSQEAQEQNQAAEDLARTADQKRNEAAALNDEADSKIAEADAKQRDVDQARAQAADLRQQATALRQQATALRDEAQNIESLAAVDRIKEADALDSQAAALEASADTDAAAARQARADAADLKSRSLNTQESADEAAAKGNERKAAAERAKSAAAQSQKAAEDDNALAKADRDKAKQLRTEAQARARSAQEDCDAAQALREQAKQDAAEADAAGEGAESLQKQAAQAAAAADQQDAEAKAAQDQAAACAKRAELAKDAANALRKVKQDELAKADALDHEVLDANNSAEYKALDVAITDLGVKTAGLTGLTDAPLAAQQKLVDQAKADVAGKTLALNAAEVQAELLKANVALLAAQTNVAPLPVPCNVGVVPLVNPKVVEAQAKKDALDALDKKMADFVKLQKACADSGTSLATATADKDAVVAARLTQLRAQGHGPQRHSDPDHDTLKKRAVYCLDPETGDQVENVRLHIVGAAASRFKTPDDYVKAEAAMRLVLQNQVCPGGVPIATPVSAQKLNPNLITVFPVPDDHCFGYSATPALPQVMTSLGSAPQIPRLATAAGAPPVYGVVPTFPPLAYPPVPPPPHSNALLGRYQTMAEEAAKRGKSTADQNSEMIALGAAGGGNLALNLRVTALGAVTVSPPLPVADHDLAAMKAYIDTAGTTSTPSFALGKFVAIFQPVDPTAPCGEWTLLTMYPNL